jgi:GT2 family glycosyltransferase
VDNASQDATGAALKQQIPAWAYIRSKTNLGAAGRNLGLRAADTPYVALCDDDTWWEPGSLGNAADLFDAHPDVAVLTARVLVGPEDRVDSTCVVMAESCLVRSQCLPGTSILGFLAGASVVRRSALIDAGGFEPRFFIGGEEELLADDLEDLGWSLAYCDALTVHHHPSPQRDADSRRWLLVRNALWVAWLRRPLSVAVRKTADVARLALHDSACQRALLKSIGGIPWVLRHRRRVSPAVEARLSLLETERSGLK